jgi:hypothetical protein
MPSRWANSMLDPLMPWKPVWSVSGSFSTRGVESTISSREISRNSTASPPRSGGRSMTASTVRRLSSGCRLIASS